MVILILEAFVIYIPLYVLWCDSNCTMSPNYSPNFVSPYRIKFSPENIYLRPSESLRVANNNKIMRLLMLTQNQILNINEHAEKLFTPVTLALISSIKEKFAKDNSLDSIRTAYYKIYEACMGSKSDIIAVALAEVLVTVVFTTSHPVTKMEDLDDKGRPN
jgi:hypothetical protein